MPTLIGQYRIQEKIGEGGMGVIYKAEHCALEQTVAIKALPGNLSVNSDLKERFVKEAKIQAKLSHPNVVNIHNFFEFEGNHYIVMEYVEGETLEALIRSKGLIPPDQCVTMFRQMLAGIGYAHGMGIIHRDVKPSNLIIKKDGVVKITDFGIAKISGDLQNTRTGVKVGTLWYMPPEQVRGQPAGVQSDIYALGVTLFEMITGKVPFSGDSEYSIMKNIVECSPPKPRDFYPYVPLPLERTILKALAKDPADRFKSIAEFETALSNPEEYSIEAVSAKLQRVDPDPEEQVPRGAQRKPLTALLTGCAVLATLAAITFVFATGTDKKPAVAVAPPSVAAGDPKPAAPQQGPEEAKQMDALLKTAQQHLAQHHYQNALSVYEQVLTANKENHEAQRGKEQAVRALDQQRKNRAVAEILAAARAAHRRGNYDRAIELYARALRIDPENGEAGRGKEDARSARSAEERVGLRK